MEVKFFRATGNLEIAKMEIALNEWLKALPQGAAVIHAGTAYTHLEGVASLAITVFWSSGKPQLPATVPPA